MWSSLHRTEIKLKAEVNDLEINDAAMRTTSAAVNDENRNFMTLLGHLFDDLYD